MTERQDICTHATGRSSASTQAHRHWYTGIGTSNRRRLTGTDTDTDVLSRLSRHAHLVVSHGVCGAMSYTVYVGHESYRVRAMSLQHSMLLCV